MKRRAIFAATLAAVCTAPGARSHAPLVEASGRGDLAGVERLLRGGAHIEQRDAAGRTAVLAATDGNHVEVVRALIARGADVNAPVCQAWMGSRWPVACATSPACARHC